MDDKRSRILAAATRLFARYGLKKTTVGEIATAADVGKGTIYLFFDTKEDLFAHVVRREGEELLRAIRAAVQREVTSEAKLRTLIVVRFRHIEALINLHHVSAAILAELRPDIAKVRQDYFEAERAFIQTVLEEGCACGELEIGDLELVSLTIAETITALETPWVMDGYELRLEQKVGALVRLFVRGLTPTP